MSGKRIFSLLFYIFAVEGAIAFGWLLSIPSEGGRISPARFVLLACLFLPAAIWAFLGYRPPGDLRKFARPAIINGIAVLFLLLCLTLFLLRYLDPERFLSSYERFSPLLWYMLVLSIQIVLMLLYLRKGFYLSNLTRFRGIYKPVLISCMALCGIFLIVTITRLGLTPDPAYWGEPGVPLLGWQFILALILGSVVCVIIKQVDVPGIKVLLPISIYILALIVWLSVPVDVLKNSYYMRISAPNYQPYPYSDSSYYDQMSQSLLIGHPYRGIIPTRPLYISFLTVLHLLFGQNYPDILVGQTFVLALLPVVMYFLGYTLHSRSAGLIVALFFIFRELTSLLISSETRVTNTKMILVDLPTLLLLLLSCLLIFRWLESRDPKSAFVAGGCFGLLLLLRTQSMLIIPFVVMVALLVLGWRSRFFYLQIACFAAGLAIAVAPWLSHNYIQTGEVTFDAKFQYDIIASQYAAFGNLDASNYDVAGKGLGGIVLEFILKDPKHVFGFISNHFLATQVNGILALPLIEPYNGLLEPINLYWMRWDGSLAWYNAALILLYLGVISFGLGSAWRRWRWLGLLPLAFSLGYALATAVSRFSSWRYDFPADWIAYFYFGLGFAELLCLFSGIFDPDPPASVPTSGNEAQAAGGRLAVFLLAGFFILAGGLPWLIKGIAPPRYPDQSSTFLLSRIETLEAATTREDVIAFISQPDSFFQTGRLLYPRYFPRNRGLTSANPSPAFAIRDYSRLGFYLLNQDSTAMVLPMDSMPPPIPHASDVIVLGCQQEGFVEARLLVFVEQNLVYSGAPLSEPCQP
jgi:hypothetical protein